MALRFIVLCLPSLTMLLASVSVDAVVGAPPSPPPSFPAIFVFGDSLVDSGNNNLLGSLAKANFMPYGIDFPWGPTGRFSNGKILIDILGELLGHPGVPTFTDTWLFRSNFSRGVSYASAGAGVLDETGRNLGQRFTFDLQLQNFQQTLNQFRTQMDEESLSQLLAKSLTVVNQGSNDYINNYLMPELYEASHIYDPNTFAEILILRYKLQIMALHRLGLRKFLLAGVGPLGCIPNQMARAVEAPPPGHCLDNINDIVNLFNVGLRNLVIQLNADNPGSIFVYGNTYAVIVDMIQNPENYGFIASQTSRACCGVGRDRGQISCLPFSFPCSFRNQFVFWDAFHPSEAVNAVLARKAFDGPPDVCFPVNVSQMARM